MKKHHFKVFRATTRFKRFNVGLTKAVRRLHTRQRRQTNLLITSYISVDWLRFFMKSRQLYRFMQAYGAFTLNAYSASVDFANKRMAISAVPGGVNSYACSRILLQQLTSQRFTKLVNVPERHFLESSSGSALNSGLMTAEVRDYELLTSLGPNYASLDRQLHPFDGIDYETNSAATLGEIDDLLLNLTLPHVVCLRQIAADLVLLSTAGKKSTR